MYLPLFSAALGILAFNTGWYFLSFTALVPLFLFFNFEKNLFRLIIGTFLYRLVLALGAVYFVIDPFLYGLSLLIFLGLPLSFYSLQRYVSLPIANFSLPILWTFWDYLESQYTLLPMTILMFGNPLAASPFLGLAKFGGIIGLTFFAASVNALLAFLIINRDNRRLLKFSVMAIAVILIAGWRISYFAIKDNKNSYFLKKRILNVEILSVNEAKQEFDNLLASLPINKGVDLLVVPENFYKSDLENSEAVIDFYKTAAQKLNLDLSAATLRKSEDKIYKSSILFFKNGEPAAVYDKNYLTITSESWPFPNWLPFYFNSYQENGGPGEKKKAAFDPRYQHERGKPSLIHGRGFSFASPICVEFHYPEYLSELSDLNPDFILHNSNNDWIQFGLNQYLRLTNNLRIIQAVRLAKPILASGIGEYAGVFYPDGTSELVYPQNGVSLVNAIVRF